MKKLIAQIRWVFLVAVAALLGVFILQNAAAVDLQFLSWTISTRRAFLVLVCVGLGCVVGWVFGYSSRQR
ncbi:lipopolysaccharide assembly protein LapA domain-containing protein [Actibacterium pelagium]|uniref:lipopolysaccharide assembly protein LapA domain-containing protein n=1 Tax=Actibacterium pelagium TaxID=2029103 RepID=UPI00117770A1|nr:LapA family protein [Actibacterium pelagium]